MTNDFAAGNYRFIPAVFQYSAGSAALPGYEIERVRFHTWLPLVHTDNPAIAKAIDPISSPGACAQVSSKDQGEGVATYRLPAATGNGYTLLGAATVIADLQVPSGFFPEVAEHEAVAELFLPLK